MRQIASQVTIFSQHFKEIQIRKLEGETSDYLFFLKGGNKRVYTSTTGQKKAFGTTPKHWQRLDVLIPLISTLGRQRQEDPKFKASQDCKVRSSPQGVCKGVF